ncbi:MAG TPA: metallophosphoesterase family protein [Devosiaceae bacterium]|jgi:predicted phosphodiesterase
MPQSQGASERVAIISDVHGNLTALETVLGHIKASGITRIFNLGDIVGKGPRSAAAVDRCREVCEVAVQGNWDAEIAKGFNSGWPVGDWHRSQLDAEHLSYLAKLPGSFDFAISGRRARIFHASQSSQFDRVHEGAREQHGAMFSNTGFTGFRDEPQIVGYGDIHIAYMRNVGGRTLFNAGSVGNSLDLPLACYAVLEGVYGAETPAPWSLNFVRLPYDIEAEIAAAKASGMPELDFYAAELRTAVYRHARQAK